MAKKKKKNEKLNCELKNNNNTLLFQEMAGLVRMAVNKYVTIVDGLSGK